MRAPPCRAHTPVAPPAPASKATPSPVARHRGAAARGLIAARDRARARVADDGSPRGGGGWRAARGCGWRAAHDPALDALVRAAGETVAVMSGPRGSVHGLKAMARGQADAASCICCMPSRGATTTPTSVICWRGRPLCWCIVAARGGVGRCERQSVGGARGRRPGRPALAWRGGAARRVCCWKGCWPRPASRQRARAANRRTLISRWRPRSRRAPPTLARLRRLRGACDLDFVGVTVEHSSWRARGRGRRRCRASRALHEFAAQVAALGGYDLTRTGEHRRAT